MSMRELEKVARALVAPGKGILAADESTRTIARRFESLHVACTEESRRAYRELLFTTRGIENWLSGVILFDETVHQKAQDGTPFAELLARKGILPGIKVDKGAVDLPGFPGEKVTEGLDGLRERLGHYRELGARFAKWRAVIAIGREIPSRACLEANAHALARYAAACQAAHLVPIVEPEVLMDGDHDIARCDEVTSTTLRIVFAQLAEYRVHLEGMLLKPNMVLPGAAYRTPASVAEVAERTVRCLRRAVPGAVPGVVFLSGGQPPELATEHLAAMNALGAQPWALSFSFARALQEPALKAWRGEAANIAAAQRVFAHRARCNSAARQGQYSREIEARAA